MALIPFVLFIPNTIHFKCTNDWLNKTFSLFTWQCSKKVKQNELACFSKIDLIYFLGNNPHTSTQQRASLGRFAALINNSTEDTDHDDFIPTTQKRVSQINTQTTKRKLTNSYTNTNTIEKKRTKKSNLFQDVVSVTSLTLQENRTSPPPPWLDLPIGSF